MKHIKLRIVPIAAAVIIAILLFAYYAGPKPAKLDVAAAFAAGASEPIPDDPSDLEAYVRVKEAAENVRPDNGARIVWADAQNPAKTEYAVVYLHGFSAVSRDAYPVHEAFAREFKMNLYLSRLYGHGLEIEADKTPPLENFTAAQYLQSAAEALAIGRKLGQKVILMGTSAGGALSLSLAAFDPQDVAAVFALSPAVRLRNPAAGLLNNHWGLSLARIIFNGNVYAADHLGEEEARYWYSTYGLTALTELQEFIETAMNKNTFRRVTAPTWTGVYYKDKKNQDDTISVRAAEKMVSQLGSARTAFVEFPTAGQHVIGSDLRSGAVFEVTQSVIQFWRDVQAAE